ncbi:NAD-dependent epimerase/dehydratase family protein [Micromonospora sp. WMMD1155]|uniref:NAD-dependent epimerase/dehydratase family protein n=1 Tax=Micromonospora sp. WMMD1155 TaxID=3016094 RepID=UPI00249BEFCB|nr:NAD-dependent epimerase/dehydratase family protein [Micromonospora sp. WMMD1155]WFE49209.1 NAD-dependent epimerase/dehydratase family protein [Micromonospora sp. WMMD1155]
MKVVVTGGAGFIGANLVRALLAEPGITSVVAVDDLSTGLLENLDGLPVPLLRGTILDPDLLDEAVAGAASVVHLGALGSVPRSVDRPLPSHHANATGTLSVLEAARRHDVGQVIVASSSSVYGANPVLPRQEGLRPVPVSPYAVSKLAAEAYTIAYAACYGMQVLPFRFFNVFGPRQAAHHAYAAVVPRFVSAALAGQPLQVHGDGRQTRDFTYVGSVTDTLVDAVLRRVGVTDVVNLAFGARVSLLELIAELEEIMGRRLDVVHAPARPGDVRDSQANSDRLRELFPTVRPTPLRAGLEQTVAWMSGRVLAGQ